MVFVGDGKHRILLADAFAVFFQTDGVDDGPSGVHLDRLFQRFHGKGIETHGAMKITGEFVNHLRQNLFRFDDVAVHHPRTPSDLRLPWPFWAIDQGDVDRMVFVGDGKHRILLADAFAVFFQTDGVDDGPSGVHLDRLFQRFHGKGIETHGAMKITGEFVNHQ